TEHQPHHEPAERVVFAQPRDHPGADCGKSELTQRDHACAAGDDPESENGRRRDHDACAEVDEVAFESDTETVSGCDGGRRQYEGQYQVFRVPHPNVLHPRPPCVAATTTVRRWPVTG